MSGSTDHVTQNTKLVDLLDTRLINVLICHLEHIMGYLLILEEYFFKLI